MQLFISHVKMTYNIPVSSISSGSNHDLQNEERSSILNLAAQSDSEDDGISDSEIIEERMLIGVQTNLTKIYHFLEFTTRISLVFLLPFLFLLHTFF